MKNLAIAFIERELVKTTVPKAKELKKFLEPTGNQFIKVYFTGNLKIIIFETIKAAY